MSTDQTSLKHLIIWSLGGAFMALSPFIMSALR